MSSGFVVLYRSFMEWEWYDDLNVKSLFLHLILKANHKDKVWRGITIKRGQVLTSSLVLSQELNLSRQQIRTALNKLKSTNEITIKATNKSSLITLTNYGKYQSIGDTPTNKTTNSSTIEQPPNNHQVTTTNNDNNENNIDNASRYSIFLRKNGVAVSPTHPELINWHSQKVSTQELEIALSKARKAKPNGRIWVSYISAIIFNTRAENKPIKPSEAEKVWESLYSNCICAPRLIADVFGDKSDLVKKALLEGTGKQITDLKMNTPEYNQKVIKKQFINSYQSIVG